MQIQCEDISDLALIGHLLSETNLVERIDQHFPRHHLWQGASPGQLLKCLMLYMLSEGDHRMSHVETWASGLEYSLGQILGIPDFKSSEVSDDRLGNLLDLLSKDKYWQPFAVDSNECLLRVYDLDISKGPSENSLPVARMDTTSVRSNCLAQGLFQQGYNAYHSDLPQLKCCLLSVDLANFPLTMQVVSGEQADDGLYLPLWKAAQQVGLPSRGMLLVGDTKLCNEENLSEIAGNGNYYLTPLAEKHLNKSALLETVKWIYAEQEAPLTITRLAAQHQPGNEKEIALVRELPTKVVQSVLSNGTSHQHTQRWIASCSLSRRRKALAVLHDNMEKAEKAVKERFVVKRGRKTIKDEAEALRTVQNILAQYKVEELFDVVITPPTQDEKSCKGQLSPKDAVIELHELACGWRVLVTNAPQERLSPQQAILCYWDEFLVEQQFHLLLSKCSALMPVYLKKQQRILALCRICFLASQYSNLFQHRIRENLAKEEKQYLTNIVPGNPGMKVYKPTTKALFQTFKQIKITIISLPGQPQVVQLIGFKDIHRTILKLLNIPEQMFLHTICQRTE